LRTHSLVNCVFREEAETKVEAVTMEGSLEIVQGWRLVWKTPPTTPCDPSSQHPSSSLMKDIVFALSILGAGGRKVN
jgi:hypothetical protein